MTAGVVLGMILSCIEVSYGRRKAKLGRQRKIALKYATIWRDKLERPRNVEKSYKMTGVLMKRGFIGLDLMPFEVVFKENSS